MIERFTERSRFSSQQDFIDNFRIKIPEHFNFAYDVVDAWAAEQPDKRALLWTDDKGHERSYTFAELKYLTDRTAAWLSSLGLGRGDWRSGSRSSLSTR